MFSIVGRDEGRILSMTRDQAFGAAFLADHWQQRGFTDVRIEQDGCSYQLPDFRRRFVLIRDGAVPQAGREAAVSDAELMDGLFPLA